MDKEKYAKYSTILVVGVVLVLNPLYLFPNGGGEYKITYQTEKIKNSEIAQQALYQNNRVLECPKWRSCVLEMKVLNRGNVTYPDSVLKSHYSVVATNGKFYTIGTSAKNGNTSLKLVNSSAMDAVRRVSIPANQTSPHVRTAVRTGLVTRYGETVPAFEKESIIEYRGSYYWSDGYTLSHPIWAKPSVLLGIRTLFYALGIGALVFAKEIVK